MVVIETFAGDSAPDITLNITREDGTIVNLTGATVYLVIYNPDTGLATNNPSGTTTNLCEVTNATQGQCAYTWNPTGTDCPDPGIYEARLKIRYGDGSKETYALRISAGDPIASIS